VPQAKYDLVVPDYVWQAGVHCICDLSKHGAQFDYKIYGIEAGNHGNQIVKKAIEYNTYNLGHWQLVPASVTGMLATAKKLIKQHKWVVFLGWDPHWMNKVLKIHYLKDPQNLWHIQQTLVYTAVNTDFMKKNPNVARFLRQMVVGSAIQSDWTYAYGYRGIAADKVATAWIKNHMDKVSQWLQGVKTADSKQTAIEAVKAKFQR
jgi:glycine betaine/proline transport system substrate-binding protein